MLRRLGTHVHNQWAGFLALFLVLTGGVAYAANTIGSSDIIDGEVKSPDLAANSVASAKIADRQVKNADLSLGASSSNTIADGGIRGVDVFDGTLTGADIDEASLDSPLWVVVNANATVRRAGQAGTSVTDLGDGNYVVAFPHAVDNCTYSATIDNFSTGSILKVATVGQTASAPEKLVVYTGEPQSLTGSHPQTLSDLSFHLIVYC